MNELESKRTRTGGRRGLLSGLVIATLGLLAAREARADWRTTDSVRSSLGAATCGATRTLRPGLYMQVCLRETSNAGGTIAWENYVVFSNTGTSTEYIHVPESRQALHLSADAGGGVKAGLEVEMPTGGCATVSLASKKSSTCVSRLSAPNVPSGVSVETFVNARVESTGKAHGWYVTPVLTTRRR